MAGFTDFIQLELPKRPFVENDGQPGQLLARSNNTNSPRELMWVDPPSGGGGGTVILPPTATEQEMIAGVETELRSVSPFLVARAFDGVIPPGALLPRQITYNVIGFSQATFSLPSAPSGGVVLISLNGLLQHDWTLNGLDVTLDPPAIQNDSIMITWFTA